MHSLQPGLQASYFLRATPTLRDLRNGQGKKTKQNKHTHIGTQHHPTDRHRAQPDNSSQLESLSKGDGELMSR